MTSVLLSLHSLITTISMHSGGKIIKPAFQYMLHADGSTRLLVYRKLEGAMSIGTDLTKLQ